MILSHAENPINLTGQLQLLSSTCSIANGREDIME